MRIGILIVFFFLSCSSPTTAQYGPRNLILVTLDGFRWQEIFYGADSSILFAKGSMRDSGFMDQFWCTDHMERREKLMPFMWKTVGSYGQVYGNRRLNNRVNCTNALSFSYPGYSEMLVGFVDRNVRSNEKVENPNSTVLEFINNDSVYHKKVAVFSTWDVIPYVAGAWRASIYYRAGKYSNVADTRDDKFWQQRPKDKSMDFLDQCDQLTFHSTFDFLKNERPHVVFMSFDETDEHGHAGRYDDYLRSAHRIDANIAELWNWLQNDPQYKDNTTLVITTDHGRGRLFRNSWKKHGIQHPGSSQIWIGIIGPGIIAHGEMSRKGKYFQKQIASTLAAILGLSYTNIKPVGKEIETALNKRFLNLQR